MDSYKLTDMHGTSALCPSDFQWSDNASGSASPASSTITNTNETFDIHQTSFAVSAALLASSDDDPSDLTDLCLPPIAPSSAEVRSDPPSLPSSPSTSVSLDSWPSPSSSASTVSVRPLHDVHPLPVPLIPLTNLGLCAPVPSLRPNPLERSVSADSEFSEVPSSAKSYSKAPAAPKPPRYHHSGPTQSHANDYLDIPYTLRNPTPSRPRFRITLLQFPVDVPSHNVSISVLLHSSKLPNAPVASLSVLKDHLPQLNVALPPDFKFDAKSQYRMSVSVTRRGDDSPFWNHSISVPLRGKLRPHPYDM